MSNKTYDGVVDLIGNGHAVPSAAAARGPSFWQSLVKALRAAHDYNYACANGQAADVAAQTVFNRHYR